MSLADELRGPRPRRALGRAITLLESSRPEDRAATDRLLEELGPEPEERTLRIGVSGPPGVGKSTFVEALGLRLVGAGRRVAVLAVDPSSGLSGGSILGDKTRMERLGRHPEAYIRPTPSGGHAGGVGPASRATVRLCEAAGYGTVVVETVGVGQGEWRVHGMTDVFVLLAQPAAGDDLQGIKRGILELADLVVVNKTDRLPEAAAETARELRSSLHLAPPRPDGWAVPVLEASALAGTGVDRVVAKLGEFAAASRRNGAFAHRRGAQRGEWLDELLRDRLAADLGRFLAGRREQTDGYRSLLDEHSSLPAAARVLLEDFYRSKT